MGRTLESKKQIVEKLEDLLDNSEMALVLDFKGLSTKEMSDLRSRLQKSNGVCKVTKNPLMRQAIKGKDTWTGLDSLLTGTNAFVLIKAMLGVLLKLYKHFKRKLKSLRLKEVFSKANSYLKMKSKLLQNFQARKNLWHKLLGQ